MNPHTTAARLIAKHGPVESFWLVMRHVRFHLLNPRNERALAFWRAARNDCYHQLGRSGIWS